jgi:peptide deformylase
MTTPLSLLYYDDQRLRKKSEPIVEITDQIKKFAHEMVRAMVHYNGVGLAAPQVGRHIRLIVIRDEFVTEDGEYSLGEPEILINPQLSRPSKQKEIRPEGCLSIPGIHAEVERPISVHVRYQTVEGKVVEENPTGFRARVIMHENDHLNGVLYVDRLTPEERAKIEPSLRDLKEKSLTN